MKLTKKQYITWTAQVQKFARGWEFDANIYVVWGEKTIVRETAAANGEYIQEKIRYREEYETITNEHNVTYNRRTGRYIPVLIVNRLYPLPSGCYRVIEEERRDIGEAQETKKYNVLCKAAAAV